MPPTLPKPDLPDVETMALLALAFIAGNDEHLARFLSLTGLDLAALRSLAGDQRRLGAVLDHLLGWEPLLLEFCAATGLPPEHVAAARRRQVGGPG